MGAILLVVVGLVKSLVLWQIVKKDTQLPAEVTITFAITPLLFSVMILVSLLLTFRKLRSFSKRFGMRIDASKLVIHLSVSTMLFGLYVCNCLLNINRENFYRQLKQHHSIISYEEAHEGL